jgi:hypothetical protein
MHFYEKVYPGRIGRLEDWKIEKLEDWKIGRLSWRQL